MHVYSYTQISDHNFICKKRIIMKIFTVILTTYIKLFCYFLGDTVYNTDIHTTHNTKDTWHCISSCQWLEITLFFIEKFPILYLIF